MYMSAIFLGTTQFTDSFPKDNSILLGNEMRTLKWTVSGDSGSQPSMKGDQVSKVVSG